MITINMAAFAGHCAVKDLIGLFQCAPALRYLVVHLLEEVLR